MNLFNIGKMLTVNEGINRSRMEKDAVLIDVRPKEIYKKGHVAGSINIPMDRPDLLKSRVRSTETTLYVVGSADARPREAVRAFKKLGYKKAVPSGFMEDHNGFLKKQI